METTMTVDHLLLAAAIFYTIVVAAQAIEYLIILL
jgi:hypothetical protein